VAVAAAEDSAGRKAGAARGGGDGAGAGGGGGGLHRPRTSTTQGGAGHQVKIHALPFVYPAAQCWPRKGGSAGYVDESEPEQQRYRQGYGDGDRGDYEYGERDGDENGDASTAPARGGSRITGRGGASPSISAPPSPSTSRYGAGFHASWTTAPVRAAPPTGPHLPSGPGSGHNFLGTRSSSSMETTAGVGGGRGGSDPQPRRLVGLRPHTSSGT
jgi:hypothetical protein